MTFSINFKEVANGLKHKVKQLEIQNTNDMVELSQIQAYIFNTGNLFSMK